MKIISNTSIKETYVSPSCRLMPISVKLSMLTGSLIGAGIEDAEENEYGEY